MRVLLIIIVFLGVAGCEKTIKEAHGRLHDRPARHASQTIAVVRSTAAASGLAYSGPNKRKWLIIG
jgi:hypothetical protein